MFSDTLISPPSLFFGFAVRFRYFGFRNNDIYDVSLMKMLLKGGPTSLI
jgi:hypothetical protein